MMNDALAEKQTQNNISMATIVVSIIISILAVLVLISIFSQGMRDPIPVPASQSEAIARAKPIEVARDISRVVPIDCGDGPSYGRHVEGGVCQKNSSCEKVGVKTCADASQLVRNSLQCAQERLDWQTGCAEQFRGSEAYRKHMNEINARLQSAQNCFEYIARKRLCTDEQDLVQGLKAEKDAIRLRWRILKGPTPE